MFDVQKLCKKNIIAKKYSRIIFYTNLLEDSKKLSGRSKNPKYFLRIFTESNVYTEHPVTKEELYTKYIVIITNKM